MFIHVKLFNGWQELLWYRVPVSWQKKALNGAIIQVPLRNRIVPAVIVNKQNSLPDNITFTIKEAHALEPFPQDHFYIPFIKQLSNYYQVDGLHFIKRLRHFLQQKETKHRKETKQDTRVCTKKSVTLTQEQQAVCDFLLPYVSKPRYMPVVLHGVTGSGKTESYKRLIMHAIENNKTVIFLLPEITLAVSFEQRLKQELPGIAIFGFHSGTTKKEKKRIVAPAYCP